MYATSWNATGLVKPVWRRLPVEKGHREELARLTGIAATDLSALNSGAKPMTNERAAKIIAAVPGITVEDLRLPEPAISEREARSLRHRLDELADLVAHGFFALGVTPDQLRPTEEEQSPEEGAG